MSVSWRDIFLTGVAFMGASGIASAGGPPPQDYNPKPTCHSCGHGGGPKINTPNIHIGAPKIKVGGPKINVHHGGVFVNKTQVNVSVDASASAAASAAASANARSGAGGAVVVGGGGYFAPPPAPSMGAVNICIDEEAMVTKTRLVEKLVSIRAACIDDRGAPHPAARLSRAHRIETTYEGELYRCPAGSYLQVTVGNAEESYNGGSTIVCEKGEALYHTPGGQLICKPQRKQRNCFERSLLRKYGPGEKLLMIKQEETYQEKVVKACPVDPGAFTLSGGVGSY